MNAPTIPGVYTSSDEKTPRFAGLRNKVTHVAGVAGTKALAPLAVVKSATVKTVTVVATKVDDHKSVRQFHREEKDQIVEAGRIMRARKAQQEGK